MNYERIYSEFIADRIAKQPSKPEYFEKHHILPKCRGGLNGKENLIRLTPEDHFFAHCCLAKIHGGSLWFVVMSMGKGWSRKIHSESLYSGRVMVGAARRRCADMTSKRMIGVIADGGLGYFVKSGAENVLHNPTLFRWINLDTGMKRESTIYDMHAEFGFGRATWTSVQTGARKSFHGWAKEGSIIRIRGLKGKALSFVNKDGRTFTGTQSEFCKHTGKSAASASRVCRGSSVTECGWRLAGTTIRDFGNSKLTGAPNKQDKGATFTLANDFGDVITGKRSDLAKKVGGTVGAFSAGMHLLTKGKVASHKGWRLISIEKNSTQGKPSVAARNSVY